MDELDEWFNSGSPKESNDEVWKDFLDQVERLKAKPKTSILNHPKSNKIPISTRNLSIPNINPSLQPFDYKIKKKIQREKLEIEAELDLHGMSIDQAEAEVTNFILNCYRQGKIYILIITGKGTKVEKKKTLKTELASFLQNPKIAPIIISFTEAGRKHGHTGAWYILLRKRA